MEIVVEDKGPYSRHSYHADNNVYATAHDAAEGTENPYDVYGTPDITYAGQLVGAPTYQIYRTIAMFTIPTNLMGHPDRLMAAKLKLWGGDLHDDTAFTLCLVSGDDIYAPGRESHYGDIVGEVTVLAEIDSADWNIGSLNEVELSAAAIAFIRSYMTDHPARGYVPFGLRSSKDISETSQSDNEWLEIVWASGGVIKSHLEFTYLDVGSPSAPTVETHPCTERTLVALKANGYITNTGGYCNRRGFCYIQATSGDPDIDDDVVDEEDYDGYSVGAYSLDIAGLDSGLPYRVRAFASNIEGVGYGETVDSAILEFPTDNMARVSSIRRIYHPGLYRMEVALGDLGFDVDVAEAAVKKIAGEVAEPEKPPTPRTPDEAFAGAEARGRRQGELITFNQDAYDAMFPSAPVVSTKTTAPAHPPTLQSSWVDRPILDLAASAARLVGKAMFESQPIVIIIEGIKKLFGKEPSQQTTDAFKGSEAKGKK